MGNSIKGPGIFLAQFMADEAPFNSLASITQWAGKLGYKGVQLPSRGGCGNYRIVDTPARTAGCR